MEFQLSLLSVSAPKFQRPAPDAVAKQSFRIIAKRFSNRHF